MSFEVKSIMPAKVLEIHVKVGDSVTAGQEIATIESMKMEMPVEAEQGGTVAEIKVEPGLTVEKDRVLFVIE